VGIKGVRGASRALLEAASNAPPELLAAPGFLVRRLYQAYVAAWVRLVDGTLTGPQFAVLVAVDAHPGADQGSLAAAVALDRSTMADVCRRMEERGLIFRTPDVADARRKLLDLTAEGRQVLTEVNSRARALDEELLAGLDPDDRARLVADLQTLSERWVQLGFE
jgi:DNA-binding MarR family transcriptional regulator